MNSFAPCWNLLRYLSLSFWCYRVVAFNFQGGSMPRSLHLRFGTSRVQKPSFLTLDSNRRYFRMVPWIITTHPSRDHAPRSDPRETNDLKRTFLPVATNANYQTESPCMTLSPFPLPCCHCSKRILPFTIPRDRAKGWINWFRSLDRSLPNTTLPCTNQDAAP